MATLEFYFDYSSPFAYLGATQVERVAKEHGATLIWRPFLLGGLFRSIGTPMVPLFEMPEAKQRYQRLDMVRWAERWGQRFAFPTRFPMNTITALRMTMQLDNAAVGKLALPLFVAYWADDRDINDPEVLVDIAREAGFDGAALLAGCATPEVKGKLIAAGNQAVDAGLCGAPSYLVKHDEQDDGILFWGQDRLPLIDKALDGWRPACG